MNNHPIGIKACKRKSVESPVPGRVKVNCLSELMDQRSEYITLCLRTVTAFGWGIILIDWRMSEHTAKLNCWRKASTRISHCHHARSSVSHSYNILASVSMLALI